MSLFGYPADIIHRQSLVDEWGRPSGFGEDVELKAKVVEEQKLIKNAKGEEVQSVIEIHLEGAHLIKFSDMFIYLNQRFYESFKHDTRFDPHYDDAEALSIRPLHIELKKQLGTDDVKKVIVYG